MSSVVKLRAKRRAAQSHSGGQSRLFTNCYACISTTTGTGHDVTVWCKPWQYFYGKGTGIKCNMPTKRLTEEATEREMYEDWEGALQAYK